MNIKCGLGRRGGGLMFIPLLYFCYYEQNFNVLIQSKLKLTYLYQALYRLSTDCKCQRLLTGFLILVIYYDMPFKFNDCKCLSYGALIILCVCVCKCNSPDFWTQNKGEGRGSWKVDIQGMVGGGESLEFTCTV